MRLASLALFLALAGITPAGAASDDMCDSPPCTQREIEAYVHRAHRRMSRVQALRFEAKGRGDRQRANQLDRSFRRCQRRWIEGREALASQAH